MPPALKGARGITVYGVYFAFFFFCVCVNFASWVLVANLTTRENIYLRSRRINATCIRNTSSTVHSARARQDLANISF